MSKLRDKQTLVIGKPCNPLRCEYSSGTFPHKCSLKGLLQHIRARGHPYSHLDKTNIDGTPLTRNHPMEQPTQCGKLSCRQTG
eukprot:2981975-Amphidinium_carterae.1